MRTVFFGRFSGANGQFLAGGAKTANPYNPQSNTCTPTRTGAGTYSIVFGQAMPLTEYVWKVGSDVEVNAQTEVQVNVTGGTTAAVGIFVGAAGTDTNFWLQIEEIGSVSLG